MNNWDELKRLAESVPDNYSNETAQYVIFSDAADPQAILALIAESEALRKDAERYRWARDCGNSSYLYAMICAGQCGHNMDVAIDAAAEVLRKEKSNG